ncbi:hypothetical protein GN244_ATG14284 [Phytophthora infestans]|uniref:Uncharacterized protein n=1 Tax=Phytophthora infestans TaxID=4787 RepID=A0A833WQD0_PHYIN|nr:hypothetical protein GN244_ATG14284 [Phytophthora infestans]KAF4138833.1 hypothetical protein GN958_ATG12042 [Phytophthora infestans]
MVHASGANTDSSLRGGAHYGSASELFQVECAYPSERSGGWCPIVSIPDVLYPDAYILNDRKKRLDVP